MLHKRPWAVVNCHCTADAAVITQLQCCGWGLLLSCTIVGQFAAVAISAAAEVLQGGPLLLTLRGVHAVVQLFSSKQAFSEKKVW